MSNQLDVSITRVYAYQKEAVASDVYVVLVDRLWPRGVKKATLRLNEHLPDLGPSHELRKWFAHEVSRWEAFLDKYWEEIQGDKERMEMLKRLKVIASKQPLLLLYSARDEVHNQANALRRFLLSQKV